MTRLDILKLQIDKQRLALDRERLKFDIAKQDFEVKKYELNHKENHAQRQHDKLNADANQLFSAAISFAMPAARAPGIINAGAFAALLAFIAQLKLGEPDLSIRFTLILVAFGLGVALSSVATGLAYLAQFFYATMFDHIEKYWEYPYWKRRRRYHLYWALGIAAHCLAVFAVMASFCGFFVGFYFFIDAMLERFAGAQVLPGDVLDFARWFGVRLGTFDISPLVPMTHPTR